MNILGVFIAIIEWFNLSIYLTFAESICNDLLPNYLETNTKLSLYFFIILTINIAKPIGSYIFGKYSDKTSRLKALSLSFFLMFISTLTISFLPEYSKIGIISSLLFVILNFIKGLATGGNYSATLYSIENSEKKFFVSSLITSGIFLGVYCSKISFLFFNWRFSFQLASFLSLPLLFFIYNYVFFYSSYQESLFDSSDFSSNSFSFSLFFKSCSLILLDIVPFYILLSFLPNYKIIILKQDPFLIQKNLIFMNIIVIFGSPIVGYFADIFGPKFFLKSSAFLLFLSSFSCFFNNFLISYSYIEPIYYGIMFMLCYGTIYGYLPLKFEKNIRARAAGVAINFTATFVNLLLSIFPIFFNSNFYLINYIFAIIGVISFFNI